MRGWKYGGDYEVWVGWVGAGSWGACGKPRGYDRNEE